MRELIAVGFTGKHRATEVLGQMQDVDALGMIDLSDAVTVYRTKDGRLRLDQSIQPTPTEGGAIGGLLGAMLGGLLAAPFTAGLSTAAAASAVGVGAVGMGSFGAVAGAIDADDWKTTWGVPEDFVKQVGGMVQPGNSAVLALVGAQDPDAVIERFRGYGGTVLRTTLTESEAAKVRQKLAAQPARG
jgi:uncharacterized membrane protein